MRLLLSKFKATYLQAAAIFIFALLLSGLISQVPFTYTVNLGEAAADWNLLSGFGERENNSNFDFRWTTEEKAVVRLPDVGWPNRIGITGTAPRPDNSSPTLSVERNNNRTGIAIRPETASFPGRNGLLTFEASGFKPAVSLNAQKLTIGVPIFKPAGDTRSLGMVVNQIYIKPQPNRFGFVVPPLAGWLGGALACAVLFANLQKISRLRGQPKPFFIKGLAVGITALALLVVCLGRLLVPEWFAVNSAGIAWGLALPGLAWLLTGYERGNRRIITLYTLQGLGLLLVFYGLVLAVFTASLFIMCGLIGLVLAVRHRFRSHLENIVLLVSASGAVGWGLWQGQLPRTDDIPQYHLFWINELDLQIKQGILYPRWAPDFGWNQGMPTFNFYPPLSRYLAEAFQLLGMTFNSGLMLVLCLTVIFGSAGSYFFAHELLKDGRAALLGGLAFCFYPFRLADIYSTGGFATLVAGSILPWNFWLLTRLFLQPDKKLTVLGLGLSGAALATCNNPVLILFVPIGAAYMVGLALLEWRAGRLKKTWRPIGVKLALVVALAFGLSAFSLLPATLQSNQVSLQYAGASLVPGSSFWAKWPDSLALWQPVRPLITDQAVFGTLHFILALAGSGVLLWRKSNARAYPVILGAAVVIVFLLQYSPSAFLWQTFPIFTSVQFSARLMNYAIVFMAPLIGGFALLKFKRTGGLLAIATLALMVYACFYDYTVAYWPYKFDGFISDKALTEQVRNGDVMYLPVGIANAPEIERYNKPEFVDKRATGSNDQLNWTITGPGNYRLDARASGPGEVTLPLFWYKDWFKITDSQGNTIQAEPSDKTRWVQVPLPAGPSTLTLKLQDTPVQFLANLITILTLISLLTLAVLSRWAGLRSGRRFFDKAKMPRAEAESQREKVNARSLMPDSPK